MPIKVKDELPAIDALLSENVFVMPASRANSQDIRPMRLGILNLMPNKVETEVQLIRLLANTPLQISLDLIRLDEHRPKNTPEQHLNNFYQYFSDVQHKNYDGIIVTGAPLGKIDFESVTYWPQLTRVFDWAERHVTSSMFICWAAHAALYHHYGLCKQVSEYKHFGVFRHQTLSPYEKLTRGFDDYFWAPQSRYAEMCWQDVAIHPQLLTLATSKETGAYLVRNEKGSQVFVTGHPEYDRTTLDIEYKRDLSAGLSPALPENYYPDNDPEKTPNKAWRAHAYLLMCNWLNYYVYQETPYDLDTPLTLN